MWLCESPHKYNYFHPRCHYSQTCQKQTSVALAICKQRLLYFRKIEYVLYFTWNAQYYVGVAIVDEKNANYGKCFTNVHWRRQLRCIRKYFCPYLHNKSGFFQELDRSRRHLAHAEHSLLLEVMNRWGIRWAWQSHKFCLWSFCSHAAFKVKAFCKL